MKRETIPLREESGFTLIEVLIAMVILSIGIIALTSMQTTGIKGNATANILTTGGTWAADSVERVFAMDFDVLADGTTTSTDGKYTITWDVTDDNPMPDTKTIDITVTSQDSGNQRSVDINYIKAKYVK
jgi:type IV pilus assembly protein PilV